MDNNLLVIGYGNTLRCDDGVGPKAVAEVELLDLPYVHTLACPQLTPEIADPLAKAAVAIFVDASVDFPGQLRLRRMAAAGSSQILAHAADPQVLLALSRDAFGRAPEAWMLTIPAEVLGFGEDLSPTADRGVKKAVQSIRELHRKLVERGKIGPQAEAALAGKARPEVQVRA